MATGGFVSRAARGSIDAKAATSEVGPGDYELSSPTRRGGVPAAVPFNNSSERNLLENTGMSAFTPGPGAYETTHAQDVLATMHILPSGFTANFASGTSRLAQDTSTRKIVPGPGAYQDGNVWVKPRYKAAESKQRIVFDRAPTAPSIPAGHQSYGYEEGERGHLVMQKPAEPIHTGVGRDTVGPGAYELRGRHPGSPAAKATTWGKDNAKRGMIYKKDVPGPGTYNIDRSVVPRSQSSPVIVQVNGVDVQFGGTAGTAQFVSKVPLASQRQVTGGTPGPGAYQTMTDGPVKSKSAVAQQAFGTISKRSFEVDPIKSHSAPTFFQTPGPGSYESANQKGSFGFQGNKYAEPLPFSSTSSRFADKDNGVPGPGGYRPEDTLGLARQQEARVAAASRTGVFGGSATADRFRPDHKEKEAAAGPSPGAYETNKEPSPHRHRGDTSAFQSKTNRFRAPSAPPTSIDRSPAFGLVRAPPKGDAALLGPGTYSVPDPWGKTNRHPGYRSTGLGFGSDSKRASPVHHGSVNTPGPGRYNHDIDMKQVFRPYTVQPKDSSFGAQSSRFASPSSYTPGPGRYQVAQGGFDKKSFNATYSS